MWRVHLTGYKMELPTPKKEEELEHAFDSKGNLIFKKKSNVKKGKKSKAGGGAFELKVRRDLETKGWIVDKWTNNVDLNLNLIHPAKRKYNPFSKVMSIGTGFPDFLAFQKVEGKSYNIVGVEVKTSGTLSLEEKKKCKWYLDNGVFSRIWIAKKKKEGRGVVVEYNDFEDIWKRVRS